MITLLRAAVCVLEKKIGIHFVLIIFESSLRFVAVWYTRVGGSKITRGVVVSVKLIYRETITYREITEREVYPAQSDTKIVFL